MPQAHMIPHLSETDLLDLNIQAEDIIAMLERMIAGASKNTVWAAPKAVLHPPDGRYVMATLAAMDNPPLVATKSLVLNARNSDIGLPQINSLVTLLHGQTGVPLATMDGNWVTALRTAGLSALAASYMANKAATIAGFVGTGVQARSHLQLFAQMFPLKQVLIFGRGAQNIEALAQYASDLGLTFKVCDSAQDVVEGADLIVSSVTHTSVNAPFLDARGMKAGSFASSVDLGVPWHKDGLSQLSRVIIDDLEQEAALPNKLANPDDITGDLAALVSGRVAGRKGSEDRTAFVFRGHALGDLALAALAYETYQDAHARA